MSVIVNFSLYKYDFEPIDTTGSELQKCPNVSKKALNEIFAKSLEYAFGASGTLNLYNTVKDRKGVSSPVRYHNHIDNCHNGVTMLTVKNNKTRSYVPADSSDAQKIGHFPQVRVIIDTREDSWIILVERKSSSFYDADDVMKLISLYGSQTVNASYLGYQMTYNKRLCKGQLWEIITSRIANDKDRIRQLVLKFDNKRKIEGNAVNEALQRTLELFNADECEMKLGTGDEARKLLDQNNKQAVMIITNLLENDYRLAVFFKHSGSIEYGKEAAAVYGISKSICDKFVAQATEFFGDESIENSLSSLLKTIAPETEDYKYLPAEDLPSNSKRKKAKSND